MTNTETRSTNETRIKAATKQMVKALRKIREADPEMEKRLRAVVAHELQLVREGR